MSGAAALGSSERAEAAEEVQLEAAAQLVFLSRRSAVSQCRFARRDQRLAAGVLRTAHRTLARGRTAQLVRHDTPAGVLSRPRVRTALRRLAAVLGGGIQRPADRVSFRL